MPSEVVIKNMYGRNIGRIRTLDNGDKEVYDFYGRIIGWYRASLNATLNNVGRIIAYGDATASLIKDIS